jgi:ribonucleotide reductase beta subunit family protein with ferritin-like domain
MDAFWTPHDVEFTDRDAHDWDALTDTERLFFESILSFFATADSIVNENLLLRLFEQIESQAARAFFSFQGAMETIHGLVYAKLLEGYVKDPTRLEELRAGDIDSVREQIQWCQKWIHADMSVAERLLVYTVIEGVFFSGPFCAIYWAAQRGILPALCKGNKLIAPDEGLHVGHDILQYRKQPEKVPHERARDLFMEAVGIAERFITRSIDCEMIGMNRALMFEYIKHVANNIFTRLGYPALFASTIQPFPFMARLCFDAKENFLEMRAWNYQRTDIDEFTENAEI